MNVNDTEIVWSILNKAGYERVLNETEAEVVLIMTCSIREGAEQKIWSKLKHLRSLKATTNLQVCPLQQSILSSSENNVHVFE